MTVAATDVARALDGRVELVHVFHPDEGRGGVSSRIKRGIEHLANLADELRADGVDVSATPRDGFHPASVLRLHAQERRASLLAVGSHGRSGFSRVALGSVAFRVVRRSSVPVLVTGPGSRARP